MNFKGFYIGVLIRVVFIALTALLAAFLAVQTNYWYSIVTTFIILILQAWNLISYINAQGKELRKLLTHIKENSGTMHPSQVQNPAFKDLNYFLKEINEIIHQAWQDKEEQVQFNDLILQHVQIGLLAFDENEKIIFINPAAKQLLPIHTIHSLPTLRQFHPRLTSTIQELEPGTSRIHKLKGNKGLSQLRVSLARIKFTEKTVNLVSFQDITKELDEQEAGSWQKLMRVLIHEITNAITPVTSLTSTIGQFFIENNTIVAANKLSDEKLEQAVTGLDLIEERGHAVLDFVNNFKSLAHLPKPVVKEIPAQTLIANIVQLKKEDLNKAQITIEYKIAPESLSLKCDQHQLEQVLLNLINNAMEAMQELPNSVRRHISIDATPYKEVHCHIKVSDTGRGIPEDLQEEIFVPFFTTKENGSGIGLSLSRQIAQLHGGKLSVFSNQQGTTFNLFI
ncbi:MAG: sensor histidine kinase [Bacteroidota bacterium]